jgi:hypothetical protein
VLLALSLAACRGDLDRAVDPIWGKQPCEHCKMLVSQRASAAQVVVDGERHYFDDLGCMVQWLDEKRSPETGWVRLGEGWTQADRARYRSGAMTPMDHGFIAAADGETTWPELRARVLSRAKGATP